MAERKAYILATAGLLLLSIPTFAATSPAPTTAKADATKATATQRVVSGKSAVKKSQLGGNVVAVVNGEKITKDELSKVLYTWYSPVCANDLVLTRVVGQAAKKHGVVITDKQVQAKIDQFCKDGGTRGLSFSDYMLQSGRTVEYARAMMKMTLQAEAIRDKTLKITPDDMDAYRKVEDIEVLIKNTDPAEKDANEKDALAKTEEIQKAIAGGMSFEDAAKKYSDNPNTKEKGGMIGWIKQGRGFPDLEKAVWDLKPGEVSKPVRTPYGYHVMKLVAVGKDAMGTDKNEIIDLIRKNQGDIRQFVVGLQREAVVENAFQPKRKATQPQPGMSNRPMQLRPNGVKPGTPGAVRTATPIPTPAPVSTAPAAGTQDSATPAK